MSVFFWEVVHPRRVFIGVWVLQGFLKRFCKEIGNKFRILRTKPLTIGRCLAFSFVSVFVVSPPSLSLCLSLSLSPPALGFHPYSYPKDLGFRHTHTHTHTHLLSNLLQCTQAFQVWGGFLKTSVIGYRYCLEFESMCPGLSGCCSSLGSSAAGEGRGGGCISASIFKPLFVLLKDHRDRLFCCTQPSSLGPKP